MSKLILHVGTHKTGTTSIQSFFHANRERLKDFGIYYPDATRYVGVEPEMHQGVAAALARGAGPVPKALQRFHDHLRQSLGRHEAVVLSSEAFYRHVLPSPPPGKPLPPAAFWGPRETYLARVSGYFGDLAPTISIYFRNPLGLAESNYANTTVSTPFAGSFAAYRDRTAQMYEYGRHLEAFRRHFPAVLAHSYERSAKPDLIASFFTDNGLPTLDSYASPRMRTSLKNRAVLWIQRLKAEQEISEAERRRRWHFALRDESQPLFEESEKSSFWESGAARAAFFETYGAPVGDIAFAPPQVERLPLSTRWDDGMHAAASKAYGNWIARNEEYMRQRERRAIPPYAALSGELPAGPSALVLGARRLRRRLQRMMSR